MRHRLGLEIAEPHLHLTGEGEAEAAQAVRFMHNIFLYESSNQNG
jgi:hypothetical protein